MHLGSLWGAGLATLLCFSTAEATENKQQKLLPAIVCVSAYDTMCKHKYDPVVKTLRTAAKEYDIDPDEVSIYYKNVAPTLEKFADKGFKQGMDGLEEEIRAVGRHHRKLFVDSHGLAAELMFWLIQASNAVSNLVDTAILESFSPFGFMGDPFSSKTPENPVLKDYQDLGDIFFKRLSECYAVKQFGDGFFGSVCSWVGGKVGTFVRPSSLETLHKKGTNLMYSESEANVPAAVWRDFINSEEQNRKGNKVLALFSGELFKHETELFTLKKDGGWSEDGESVILPYYDSVNRKELRRLNDQFTKNLGKVRLHGLALEYDQTLDNPGTKSPLWYGPLFCLPKVNKEKWSFKPECDLNKKDFFKNATACKENLLGMGEKYKAKTFKPHIIRGTDYDKQSEEAGKLTAKILLKRFKELRDGCKK